MPLIETSRLTVRISVILNRIFLAAVLALLALTFVIPHPFASLIVQSPQPADLPALLAGLRLEMLLGIVMALATDRLLVALAQMIATARQGDPFVTANAARLRVIGWSLLVLQLLDLAGMALARLFPALGSAAPTDSISLGGWVAVMLIFVLARIFAAGTAMRDELAATV